MASSLQTDQAARSLVQQHIWGTGKRKKALDRLSIVDHLRSPGQPRIVAESTNVVDFSSSSAHCLVQHRGVLPNAHRGP